MPVPVFADQPTRVLTRSAAGQGLLLDADLPYTPTTRIDEQPLLEIPSAKSRAGQIDAEYVNPVSNSVGGNGTTGWAAPNGSISSVAVDGTPDGATTGIRYQGNATSAWISPVVGPGGTRTVPQLVDNGARPVTPGQTLHIRFWVKRDHPDIASSVFKIRLYTWKIDGTWNSDNTALDNITPPAVGVWTLLVGSITIPANSAFAVGALRLEQPVAGAMDLTMTGYADNVGSAPPDAMNGVLNNAIFTGTAHQTPSLRLRPTAMNPIPSPRGTVGWYAYQGGSVSNTYSYPDSPDLGENGTCFRTTMTSTPGGNPLILNPNQGDSASGTVPPSTLSSRGYARVQSSGPYTARCWVRSASADVTSFQLRAYYRNASGAWISAQPSPTLVSAPSVNNWYLLQYTFTAPAGAAWATFWPSANAPAGSAHDFRATYAWHGAGTAASYVDGAMPGAIWRGTAHNSASYRLI